MCASMHAELTNTCYKCNEVSFSRKSFFANLSKLFPLSVGIVGSLGLILISWLVCLRREVLTSVSPFPQLISKRAVTFLPCEPTSGRI